MKQFAPLLFLCFFIGEPPMERPIAERAWTSTGSLKLYVGVSDKQLRHAFRQAVREADGRLFEGSDARVKGGGQTSDGFWYAFGHGDTRHSLWIRSLIGKTWSLERRIGALLDCYWLQLDWDDDGPWRYSLWKGGCRLDSYTVSPAFDFHTKEQPPAPGGTPRHKHLGELLDVPADRIENYFKEWPVEVVDDITYEFAVSGKAYPDDEFEAGDPLQVIDFAKALQVPAPTIEGRLKLPPSD